MENNVVYIHKRKDTNEVFYVGIGDEKRPYKKKGRNIHWQRIVQKHGYDVHIIHTNLTWLNACEIEKKLISEYGRKDLGLGYLVNMTNGGEGAFGRVVKDKTRKQLSDLMTGRYTGEDNPFYGKTHSEETILKMLNTKKENPYTPTKEHKDKWKKSYQEGGYHPSEEIINRISKNMPHHCPIDVWLKDGGEYYGRFHGYSTFVREVLKLRAHDEETKKAYTTAVSKICGIVRGRLRNKSYKGYTFKLVTESH